MGILKDFRDFRRARKGMRQTRDSSSAAAAPRNGGISLLGIGSRTSLAISTVYQCVAVIANSVAGLPIEVLRRRSDGLFVPDDSDLSYLLNVQPDFYISANDFWKMVVRYLLLRGNAYIIPERRYGSFDYQRLALPDPTCVAYDSVNNLYTVNDVNTGVSGTYREWEVIHIKNYSHDGKVGQSTLEYAAETIRTAAAGANEIRNRFANGGNVRGILGNNTSVVGFGHFADSELDKAAVDIDSKFSGGQKIVSVPGDARFSPISLSSADMQFLETMKFSVTEICRFFGVHPSFVFSDTSTNYKSSENAQASLLTQTVNPILEAIENELLRKLIAPALAGKRRIRFDRGGFFAADPQARADYMTKTIAAGLYTVNEWRMKENRPPVEGGDTVMVSANLKAVSDLAGRQDNDNNYDGNADE